MRKCLLLGVAAWVLATPVASAIELGPISLGFHFNPALEALDGRRSWDLSMSLGVRLAVGSSSHVEFSAMVDSAPSSLGATVVYHQDVAEPFEVGAGLNMFWQFETAETLVRTVIGSFAHATVRTGLFDDVIGEAGVSFPLVAFARQIQGWDILPLAELPALHLAGEWRGLPSSAAQGRVTLQPVILDTTQFVDPIGRLGDRLIILPTFSAYLRYLPQPVTPSGQTP